MNQTICSNYPLVPFKQGSQGEIQVVPITVRDLSASFFHDYEDAPLLIVNAEEIDPINDERDYMELFEEICSADSGRRYFNPIAHNA